MIRNVPLLFAVALLVPLLVATPGLTAGTPVQVYILLGQSNMVGMGDVVNTTTPDGSLDYAVHTKGLYSYLDNGAGGWSERTDVRHVYVQSSGTARCRC